MILEVTDVLKAIIIAFGGWYIIYHRRTVMNEISWYTCMVAVYTADKLHISDKYLYKLGEYGVLHWPTCSYWIHEFILESGDEEEGEEEGPGGLEFDSDSGDLQFDHWAPLHGLEFDPTAGSPSPYQLSPDGSLD